MLKSFIKPNLNYKPPSFISATEFENFINNDLICDWLSIVHPKKIDKHPFQLLFNKGIHYEAHVLEKLRKKLKLELPKLSSLSTSREYTDYEHEQDLKITIKEMKKGEPLLYSSFIASDKEGLRGIPDLLVRNDYIDFFFGIKDVPEGSSIFGDYYYIPIEIKYSALHFDKSQKTLLNINRTKIYKTQLCAYSKILSDLQGTFPICAFIIGKNDINILGHVYFQTRDNEIIKLFYEGLNWLRDIKKNAFDMDFSVRLLPNMKISHPIYDKEKKIIAEYYGEITQFWQCSIKHRYFLLDKTNDEIYSWKHPDFDYTLLETNLSYQSKIEKLFKVNRGEIDPIYPLKIKHDHYNWYKKCNEIYIDFETVGNPDENEESTIFLIGVYVNSYYYSFVADNISPESEKKIILEFYNFWNELNKPKIWYWYAEEQFWNRVCKKYNLDLPLVLCDLYKVFFDGNVFIKGCKNFKLKSYINALLKLKQIKIKLPPEDCCNGIDALFLGLEYYETKDETILKTILEYNKFDCYSLYVLLDFIRREM